MHVTPGPGHGLAWQEKYDSRGALTLGLHHFNKWDTVQDSAGLYATVINRDALTAEVKWDNGTIDLIPQFDPRYTVVSRHVPN